MGKVIQRNYIEIDGRPIGEDFTPFIIAELGINHGGKYHRAIKMIRDAKEHGCECIKIQSHIPEEEMRPGCPLWDVISKCSLTEEEERGLKEYTEKLGMIFLSTPFSKKAVDRLVDMDVPAFKIGSGECNDLGFIEYICDKARGKPILLSTGMNDIKSIKRTINCIKKYNSMYGILQCTSIYPTPYYMVRLGVIEELRHIFPNIPIGLSDHTMDIYTSLGAVALGASIIEKHFTSDKHWRGPDMAVSIDPQELNELIVGANAIYSARGGCKDILEEEMPVKNMRHLWFKRE